MPPTLKAMSYRAIYAYGKFICVENAKEHLTINDYGVMATFEQECVLGSNDQRPIRAKLEYVGWVEEILELNYGVLNIVVLLCNRVKANYIGNNATMKWNEYDFTFVNFSSLIHVSNQSFVFPFHVQQFFFSNDQKERGWKVVLQKDPYGKWITKTIQVDLTKFDMFKLDNIDDYTCLQAPISIRESIQLATIVGGYIVPPLDLVVNEGEDDGIDNTIESTTSCDNDG